MVGSAKTTGSVWTPMSESEVCTNNVSTFQRCTKGTDCHLLRLWSITRFVEGLGTGILAILLDGFGAYMLAIVYVDCGAGELMARCNLLAQPATTLNCKVRSRVSLWPYLQTLELLQKR